MIKKPHKKHVFKKKKTGVNATGRPTAIIDIERVRELARFMYSDEEIAMGLGIAAKTFSTHKRMNPAIIDAIADGHANGRRSLRAKQLDIAMKGNVTMLIWLGKQYLDQKEKTFNENETKLSEKFSDNPAEVLAQIIERNRLLGIGEGNDGTTGALRKAASPVASLAGASNTCA